MPPLHRVLQLPTDTQIDVMLFGNPKSPNLEDL